MAAECDIPSSGPPAGAGPSASGWRDALEAFAAAVPGSEGVARQSSSLSSSITFSHGLTSGERAAVHDAARHLGLASRSKEGPDGVRAVTVFRKEGGASKASAAAAAPSTSIPHPRALPAAADHLAADAAISAFEDSHVNLREDPFDLYRALRIPRREGGGGGYSGGTARARASYHREAVRGHPENMPPGCGACHGCGGVLKVGRWMHRHAALRPDAPANDLEFGIGEDDDEDDIIAAAGTVGGRVGSNSTVGFGSGPAAGRRDLCLPCHASHIKRHRRMGDRNDAGAGEPSLEQHEFTLVTALGDLGRERPRYDTSMYADFRKRRAAAADVAAMENARALAAVSGPVAMARVRAIENGESVEVEQETEEQEEKDGGQNGDEQDEDEDEDDDAPPEESGVGAPTPALLPAPHPTAPTYAGERAEMVAATTTPAEPALDVAPASGLSPGFDGCGSGTTRFAAEVARFHRITVAYLVLRHPERVRVLDEHGFSSLVKSEAYLEEDVFDADPWVRSFIHGGGLSLASCFGTLCPATSPCSFGTLCPATSLCSFGSLRPATSLCSFGTLCPATSLCSFGTLCPATSLCSFGTLCPATSLCSPTSNTKTPHQPRT